MISYGYPLKENDDPIVNVVEAATSQFSECLEPGAFMVDMIPLRKPRFLHQPIPRGTDCIFFPPPIRPIPVIDTQLRIVTSFSLCFLDRDIPGTRHG